MASFGRWVRRTGAERRIARFTPPPVLTNDPETMTVDYPPTIYRHRSADEVAHTVASLIVDQIAAEPTSNLGLATGGTPVPIYRQMVQQIRQQKIDVTRLRTFNLDEYVGLSADHPCAYRPFMRQHLFDPLGIDTERTHFPPVAERDPTDYDRTIESAGGIGLQLLGIGINGHIAFNEPGCDPAGQTARVALTQSTRDANARFFDSADDVPTHAVTMGIATILRADRIVVAAVGANKQRAFEMATTGPIGRDCPASLLRRHASVQWHVYFGD